ncbi:hypothetical protein GobsT_60770 [Gemmata obscuriglobus]|uniref:DUF4352 domain-containing protein n=1 Tax=Gemmata obscuriglobus TaxID=114 RepID=A0A2Z3GQN5_9BACT|nr:hypothetical protein [Gemmata obscuriglobus]AWM36153.1 hypothetical protein C1280_03445 [Gemmata obscuriglobus]QEG31256.1 hypothetical protein GobsT_60770 [Gemmata obscuriglobus]VTS10594.1 unnamed protein product [Gemmata obscuriglobus UQM 2246]
MPTFIAICPYCRAGGVRAPAGAAGASATCPKCRSNFTLAPEEHLPGWAKAEPGAAPAKPLPPAVEETRSTAALPDVTEPSPVIPSEPYTAPVPRPAVVAPVPARPPADTALVVALGAIILVGPAMLATQLPFGRAIGTGIAALGLLAGLMSFGANGKARLAASAAVLMHAAVAAILLLLPSWVGLASGPDEDGPKPPTGPVAVSHATGEAEPIAPGRWLDASKVSWQFGDARVVVRDASVGPIELTGPNGAKRATREPYLRIALRVRNTGTDQALPLTGWAAGRGASGVRVLDSTDRPLAPAAFDAGWEPDRGKPTERVLPGHTSEVVFVFAPPTRRAELVRVHLTGAPVGSRDDVSFRVSLTARQPLP